MSLIKSSATIGFYTLASRVLGFVRDITIASGLGASFLSDAFFVAFKLPNFLRRLFAEGAFNAAFVPLYAGSVAADGQEKATKFASEAMSLLLVILFIVTGIFIVCMPWLMFVLAPGFADDPDKFDLTIALTRITMPYIIFISLVSLLGGILNSSQKFAAVAATPILMNLSLIIVPLLLEEVTPNMAHALAVAVFVAGVVQWLWLVYFCAKQGVLPKFTAPKLTPEVKKLLLLIGPAALGAGVAQINLFIDLIIASQFDGGVSYLYYADRINELPLAVIGIAVGTALLPMLSKQIRLGDMEKVYHSQNRAIGFTLMFSLPAAAALMTIAEPIIRVMFERGAFGPAETAATSPALVAFAAGLPAFILIKILAPCFYANQDTKTPFKIASVCILVNLFFNLALMGTFRHVGMAMATSIAGWVNVALMLVALRRRSWIRIEGALKYNIIKILASCGLMVASLLVAESHLGSWLVAAQWQRFSALVTLSVAGGAVYMAVTYGLNVLQIRTKL
ncbi:MAG: murein biosynthesis integral membrane protein MurJ [Alphaproteobacteria bacterium]|nr:murein biosynthesis integral membrane protein MurJ [Alphaproteobacteria bacterium]